MNCDTVNSCLTKKEMNDMSDEVVCTEDLPIQQTAERVVRVTQAYWAMMARRVELEQDNSPVRRKRNEEEN